MDVLSVIENRFSCTDFVDEPIPHSDIESILEAGRRAPSAKNRQPWRFIVIDNKDLRTRLESAAFGQEHVGKAPLAIAFCSTNIDYTMPNGQQAYPIDLSIASSFMMLQAESMEYATCYITTFDEAWVKEIISVPYSMNVVMLLLNGKAAARGQQKTKKTLREISSKNHW